MNKEDQAELEISRDGMELSTGDSFKKIFNIIANEAHYVGFENACTYKDKRIAELEARIKELHDFNLVLCEWKEGGADE